MIGFLLQDKLKKTEFLEKIFLLANVHIKIIRAMLLVFLSNVNNLFIEAENVIGRNFITIKDLSDIKSVELIEKKEFSKMVLDMNNKTLVLYICNL